MGYDYKLNPENFVLSHARSFSFHPKFELVGGVDEDAEKCNSFEAEYKRPAYINVESAFKDLKPSIIVISTPSNVHGSTLMRIINSYVPRVIVCEKPLDSSLEVARQMVELCHSKDVKLFVNYMRRSEPSVLKIKKMIDSEIIKAPIKASVWYSNGLLNNGSHMLNLLEYWLGEVQCCDIIRANECLNNVDPEPDFSIEFEMGSALFSAVNIKYFQHLSIDILCNSGRLYYGKGGHDIIWQPCDDKPGTFQKKFLESKMKIENSLNLYQLNFVENLYLALNGKKHFICNGSEALSTLTNIFNIIRN